MRKPKDLADDLRFMGILNNERLYTAICKIDRGDFVLPGYRALAKYDQVLPSWKKAGRIISTSTQPSLVVQMIQLLNIEENSRILDIGTGTGYATAIMAIAFPSATIVSLEWDIELMDIARSNFKKYQLNNITTISCDGYYGFPEGAPYNGIISMVAPSDISVQWFEQLQDNGILISPFFVNSIYTPVMVCVKISRTELLCNKAIDAVFIPMERHCEGHFPLKSSKLIFELSNGSMSLKSIL
ncbi:protein-L-isoaspartate O-methyltransferase family protein [Kosmotoga pacifica]|uniref:Protein-L-isoaspartate O-methyltransferase n=1 Tax=Kosmotoga pacifica TaxID=1330330 RepID=A0A0G2Z6F9_9BACT|nr:protein-L-isoaspartate O-methyltransferase [Kosmotoga pacifica]AKI97185.1 hypothetical protein IX53_04460 [Kosmotoga pacifica]